MKSMALPPWTWSFLSSLLHHHIKNNLYNITYARAGGLGKLAPLAARPSGACPRPGAPSVVRGCAPLSSGRYDDDGTSL